MNAFFFRSSRAWSLTAVAAIVLTAGAVSASGDEHTPDTRPQATASVAALHTVDGTVSLDLGDCPMIVGTPDGGTAPDGDAAPGSGDATGPAPVAPGLDGIDVNVGVNGAGEGDATVGIDVTTGSDGDTTTAPDAADAAGPSIGVDVGIDDGSGDGAGDGTDGGDADAAPPVAGGPDGETADGGTGDGSATGSRGTQLIDLDAVLGTSGASLDVLPSTGPAVDLGLGTPAADDPATDVLVDVEADGNDLDHTSVSVAGDEVVHVGAIAQSPGTAGLGTIGSGAGGGLIGDVTVVDGGNGSSPFIDVDAPVTATT
ncbi:MAG: hypothetical protein AB7L17_15130 [Ilumatobacteraceae bacterium]